MKEAIIKYKDSKTLEILNSLARYFDFSISLVDKKKPNKKQHDSINGVPIKRRQLYFHKRTEHHFHR